MFRIANDDQYASNVPDGFVTMAMSEAQGFHEGGVQLGEELLSKSHPPHYNSITSRNGRIKTDMRETGTCMHASFYNVVHVCSHFS